MEHVEPSANPKPYTLTDEAVPSLTLPHASAVVVRRDPDALIDRVAADLVVHARECVREFGDFHLALSGGSTPEPLYRRLMYDPMYRSLPWRRTHLWIVDERPVPFDDPQSNFGMIRDLIVEHADIPAVQVHPIEATRPDAAEAYEESLREHLGWRERGQDRLDFVLLGMGADGHTASLFPHSDALAETEKLVCANAGGQTPAGGRITMTYPLLNAARFLAVLVIGEAKAEALASVHDHGAVCDVPIAGVQPVGGELVWYVDALAAGRIHRNTDDSENVTDA